QIAQTLVHGPVVVNDIDAWVVFSHGCTSWSSDLLRRTNMSRAGGHDGMSAASIAFRRSSSLQGLDKTATAPAARACARMASSAYAVMKMIAIRQCITPS